MAEHNMEGTVVGFEEGRLWLPSHVLGDTCDSKEYIRPQQYRRSPGSSPEVASPRYHQSFQKPGSRSRHRPKYLANRMSGGPGMQAIFLGSSQKSCGTGFFLPRRPGHDHDFQQSKKPESTDNPKSADCSMVEKRNSNEAIERVSPPESGVFAKPRSTSPEIFLPKEWSY